MRLLARAVLFFILFFALPVCADTFVVHNIRVQGLQGLSPSTVISYLPIQVGQEFDTARSKKIINALYSTGFFSNVSLTREGNTLIIRVVERPMLASIVVTGNKTITPEQLNPILKQLGLVQGQVFNAAQLEIFRHSLADEYDSLGKYNAKVTATVTPESRNRVAVKVDISEGRTALVRKITFIGNHNFTTAKLLRQLPLTSPRPWSFFTRGDLYSSQKLHDTLTALSDFQDQINVITIRS